MKKIRIFITLFVALAAFIGLIYFVVGSLKPKIAGVYINTNPQSTVWLNGREIGKTPFRDTTKPGESIIKLIPDDIGNNIFLPYETKIDLIAGVETVIRYDFAENESMSSGDIISFEKDERGQTSFVAVSTPDSATIIIDNQQRAFAPYKTSTIAPGDHTLKFSYDGYQERIVKVKIYSGYKLTAVINLAKSNQVQKSIENLLSPTPAVTRDMVEILSTPTGYLRVRRDPSSVGDEVGRVNPGERYPLIEIDVKTGWYKIEFEPGSSIEKPKQGWISSQYAKKILANPNISTTPTPKTATSSGVTKIPTVTPTTIPEY